jgi:hypothetical protein
MPLEMMAIATEEIGAGAADALEKRIGKNSWWKYLKAVLFYGPVVLIGLYFIGFALGYF